MASNHLNGYTSLSDKLFFPFTLMSFSTKRLNREAQTITVMIKKYCQDHHKPEVKLCYGCDQLLEYAYKQLQHCPFQERKTTCEKCSVHCYKPEYRERIRKVMRYAGSKIIFSNPILVTCHLVDRWRSSRKE